MNASRFFVTTAVAISALAAMGCTSPQPAPEPTPAPMVVVQAPPQEPIVTAEVMPSHPALQNERTEPAVIVEAPAPVAMRNDAVINTAAANFPERAPQADRN